MMATQPQTLDDWLIVLLEAEPADMNMVAIGAMRSGLAMNKVVCTRHDVVERWIGMSRHLRETEIDWRGRHPDAGSLHITGDLRAWTQADAPAGEPWSTSACRSCGGRVIWARTDNGKSMPVDADPNPAGHLLLVAPTVPTDPPNVRVLHTEDEQAEADPAHLHTSHFMTCPHADNWRKR